MGLSSRSLIAVLALGALTVPASASGNLFAPTADYNAVIFGNLNAYGGDSEGRLAVGGNFRDYNSYSVADRVAKDTTKYAFVVGGNLQTSSNWQVFSGNAAVGGTVSGAGLSFQYGHLDHPATPINFAPLKTYYKAQSSNLASLTNNGTFLAQYSTATLTGSNANLNVFNLSLSQATDWANASDHQITAPSGSTVVINIPGTAASMHYGMALHGIDQTHVLFNFYQANTLDIASMGVLGSVLAPDAALNLDGGNINGYTIANGATQKNGGEFHWYAFQGTTPVANPVPEPASLCAIGAGLVALARRRKK